MNKELLKSDHIPVLNRKKGLAVNNETKILPVAFLNSLLLLIKWYETLLPIK